METLIKERINQHKSQYKWNWKLKMNIILDDCILHSVPSSIVECTATCEQQPFLQPGTTAKTNENLDVAVPISPLLLCEGSSSIWIFFSSSCPAMKHLTLFNTSIPSSIAQRFRGYFPSTHKHLYCGESIKILKILQ